MKKQTFILLGATGSLAGKKIYPALGRLYRDGYLNHSEFRLIGVSFEEKTQEEFRHYVREKSAACADGKQADTFQYFSESCTGEIVYVQIDILRDNFDKLAEKILPESEVIFYFSIMPSLFMPALEKIAACRFINRDEIKIMMEKPYGADFNDTIKINRYLEKNFFENQIYRIDHYLAKEGIQKLYQCKRDNVNRWNCTGIEDVSVIIAETAGIEDRLDFYKETGAVTDVVQNHMFQLLLQTISPDMNIPSDSAESDMRRVELKTVDEKKKKEIDGILRSFDLKKNRFHCMQYLNFDKETLVYGRIYPDLEDWYNVGFNLITGKRMAEKKTQIVIRFRQGRERQVIDFLETAPSTLPEYAILILNCLNGRNECFVSRQEAEASWVFGDKIREILESGDKVRKIDKYKRDKLTVENILTWCKEI